MRRGSPVATGDMNRKKQPPNLFSTILDLKFYREVHLIIFITYFVSGNKMVEMRNVLDKNDVFPVTCVKLNDFSVQNLYMGENSLKKLNLKIGDVVLIIDSLICRIFLHKVRDITGLIIENGTFKDNNLYPSIYLNKQIQMLNINDIKRLELDTAKSITVTLIVKNKKDTVRIDSKIICDILYNVFIVDSCTINVETNLIAKLYNISAIHVKTKLSENEKSFKVTRKTEIKIEKVFSTQYILCMTSNGRIPPLAGVDNIYENMKWNIEQRSQHILICGPTGIGLVDKCIGTRMIIFIKAKLKKSDGQTTMAKIEWLLVDYTLYRYTLLIAPKLIF